jgi:hypothetical protein
MTGSHYEEIIGGSLQRFRDLYRQREEIDIELVKLRQFLYATLNMVPDEAQEKWRREIDAAVEKATASAASLADSIRKILADKPMYIFTVYGIRQALMEAGFDFSSYKSNPLSSISTTLRRMVETGELESKEDSNGVSGFVVSKKPRPKDTARERFKALHDARYPRGRTVGPPASAEDLPVSDPSHPIHHPGPIANLAIPPALRLPKKK